MDGWKRTVVPKVKKERRIKVITLGDAVVGKSCLIKRYCEKRFVSKYMATIGIDFGVVSWLYVNEEADDPKLEKKSMDKKSMARSVASKRPVSRGLVANRQSSRRNISVAMSNTLPDIGNESEGEEEDLLHVREETVKVNLFDMAGAPEFHDVRTEFYENTQGILLVFDMSKRATFERLDDWLDELVEECGTSILEDVQVVVCANKVDKVEKKQSEKGGSKDIVMFEEVLEWAKQYSNFTVFEMSAKLDRGVTDSLEHLFYNIVQNIHSDESKKAILPPQDTKFTSRDISNVVRVLSAKADNDVLSIAKNATEAEIQKGFKALAAVIHPDKNKAPRSDDAFKRLLEAKQNLLSSSSS
eukprot:m.32258 g.32258  ORF g.32258 m.32258 type:complete len:357 (+) comp9769_c0_seq1:64-1134(+)